ncbi:hypothetical protein HGB55_15070 [Lutibacter sp. B1]|nr:hypothetical protein [Lutibacter sp. B1]
MKKIILLILSFTVILTSCKKEEIKLIPKNHLLEFDKSEIQLFKLDTLDVFEIIGKKGTKIIFNRENFNVSENDKITAELTELYDFNEILFKNINTVTDKGELLETSGVIKIEFKSNNQNLSLKENSSLIIEFPNNILKSNSLFTADLNEFNQVKWKEEKQNDTLFNLTVGGGIWKEIIIQKDSISFYKKINLKGTGFETIQEAWPEFSQLERINSIGLFKNLGWINIDKIINPDYFATFELISNNKKIENLTVYFVYENLNSFISDYRTIERLNFENIPIKNSTRILIIGEYEDNLFADNIILNEFKNKTKIKMNLKVMTEEQIKNMFDK